jgi:hypothetical protein
MWLFSSKLIRAQAFARAMFFPCAAYACAMFFPCAAYACATCGFEDPSTPYYLKMILFMTSIPVLFVAGVVLYLRRKGSKHAGDE